MFQSIKYPRYVPFSILVLLFITSIAQAQWDVEVTITSTDPMVEPVICFSGINPAATNGVDADLDVITDFPPPPVGIPYLISAFKGPGLVFFSKDIRANGPWMLVVNTDNNFVLSWDITSVPPDTPLFLNPEDGSPIINMREQNSQNFMAGIYVMAIDTNTTMLFPVNNFTTSNPTHTTIDLTWTKPIDEDFAGALIVRSQNPITWSPTAGVSYSIDEVVDSEVIVRCIGADDHSTTPFTDTGLSPSTTYYYRAFAYDSEKNYSIGVEASGTTLLCGDVSGDGNVTAHDAALVLQSVVGLKDLSPDELKAADVTNDGSVTALDAALILQYSVGLITKFPAETTTAAAPALAAKSEKDALMEEIARLEAIHLNSEQQKVLEQLKSLISKRLLPKHTVLLQNYPNPFNPETWLPYELAKDATVTIRIYDVKGQLVRQLNIGKQEAGRYIDRKKAAYWDGRDGLGQAVSSGLYFYTLTAGNFRATRKLIVVK